jgi:hypothetical protein
MRRPINWVVIGISLLFLLVNLSAGRRAEVAHAATHFDSIETSRPTEFGYLRADGSFLPLPRDSLDAASFDTELAVFVWQAPRVEPALMGEAPAFTSASPAWR